MTPEQMCVLKRHQTLTDINTHTQTVKVALEQIEVTLCPLQGIYHADQYSSQ